MIQLILVDLIFLVSLILLLKTLLPYSIRILLANKTFGILPDRFRIWFVSQDRCC